MDAKEIEVTCPCCRSVLSVDVRTATVVRSARPAEVDGAGRPKLDPGRWDEAVGRVGERRERAADELEAGLSRERDKERRLDEQFEAAKRKLQRPSEEE